MKLFHVKQPSRKHFRDNLDRSKEKLFNHYLPFVKLVTVRQNMKTHAMTKWKTALEFIARCLLYSFIVILIDFVLIVLLAGGLNQITYSLSFVMLLEGGIGLVVGGAAVSFSPVTAKVSETVFHSKPWTAKRQKEVEAQAKAWIATGIILVLAALLKSAA